MPARVLSIALASVGSAYIVGLFLRWGPEVYAVDGVHAGPASLGLALGLALVLWELLGAIGVHRTDRSDSLIAFFLASGTALTGVGGFVNLRWGGLTIYHGTGYGAWVGLALAALLLAGAVIHLVEHARVAPPRPADTVLSGALAVVGAAYLVDLFLPWGPRSEVGLSVAHGLDALPTSLGLLSALAFVLWELLGALAIRRTARFDSLVAAFLAAETAVIGVAAIIELRSFEDGGLSYGAWIAIPLLGLLAAGALVYVIGQTRRSRIAV